jgi:hypothetical protein
MILFKLSMSFQQYYIPTEQLAQMVMVKTCILKMLILNLGWDADIVTEVFVVFSVSPGI